MRFDDTIQLRTVTQSYDEDGDILENDDWIYLGKCTIFPNQAAQQKKAEDSEPREYQYEVVMRIPKTIIPKEGDTIHLRKKDGTIDCDTIVRGFVTLGGRFLKLWA